MKYVSALFVPALLCGAMLAQDAATPSGTSQTPQATPQEQSQPQTGNPGSAKTDAAAPAGNSLKIAPGSVIPVTLAKTVDAKKAKSGDEVVATVAQDMKTNSGDVLVPKDTKIVGHVTEAQSRSKEQKESQLGIVFDHAVVKGDQMPLPMSIQAIIMPQQSNPEEGSSGAPSGPGSSGPTAASGGARSGSMGGSSQAQPQQTSPQSSGGSDSQPQTSARPPITGNTQGVIGAADLKLDNNAQNATQGSVVSSEKNNVKIEKGTFMLLRVNQAGQQMPQAQPAPQQ